MRVQPLVQLTEVVWRNYYSIGEPLIGLGGMPPWMCDLSYSVNSRLAQVAVEGPRALYYRRAAAEAALATR